MLDTVGAAVEKEVDRLLARVRGIVGRYDEQKEEENGTQSITKYTRSRISSDK